MLARSLLMVGPSEVSVARIAPDLARRSWSGVVAEFAARSGPPRDHLVCCVAVFGYGAGLPAAIGRVRDALEAAMPDALEGRLVVQAASSMDLGADAVGTLYLNCLFRAGLPQPFVDQIYAWALAVALPAALPLGSRARVTWPRDEDVAACIMAEGVSPQGSVQ